MVNPIIKDVARLMKSLRRASPETLSAARDELQSFSDAWLEEGDGKNLEGAGECCLADTDLASGIIPVLETWIDNNS